MHIYSTTTIHRPASRWIYWLDEPTHQLVVQSKTLSRKLLLKLGTLTLGGVLSIRCLLWVLTRCVPNYWVFTLFCCSPTTWCLRNLEMYHHTIRQMIGSIVNTCSSSNHQTYQFSFLNAICWRKGRVYLVRARFYLLGLCVLLSIYGTWLVKSRCCHVLHSSTRHNTYN